MYNIEDAVEYAENCQYHQIGATIGNALLEALRAKWPDAVEKVLAKAAVA